MKKVLFATTALVASAGIASAQGVEVSGFAEMGVIGGTGVELQFHQDIEVTFTMSGETDNGLTFGASVQLDEGGTTGAGTVTTDDQGYAVFLSGSFGTLTMGDTDGAFDWALTEVAMGGSLGDDHTGHSGYNGNAGLDGNYDGQVVRYNHSVGDFSFAVSAEIDDAGVGDPIFGVGLQYSSDLGGTTLGVGLGYQTGGPAATDEAIGLSLTAAMDSGIEARLNWSEVSEAGVSSQHIGVGLGYTMDAVTVAVNWGQYETGGVTTDGFGLAANYDLGGGAVAQFGYGSGATDTFSLGIAMSF